MDDYGKLKEMQRRIVIIGAGMAGCFLAICLAKRGFEVEVFEARPDVRHEPYDSGRSFNLTLYYRGIQAMKKAGIWDEVKKIATIAEGNAAHYNEKNVVYSPFDAQKEEILYTVHRNHMNGTLLDIADREPNIRLSFKTKCLEVDSKNRKVILQEQGTTDRMHLYADLVIGADGVNSVVREQLTKKTEKNVEKDFEDWGYKEVHVSAELAQQMKLRSFATHTWPRNNSLLIAFPNPDESFTLMFNLPLEGTDSFAALSSKEQIETYIRKEFPELTPLLEEIVYSFLNKPMGTFVTLMTEQWHDKDFMVLIGDAAHAVIPFYGQGMCAAFDDGLVLAGLIDRYKDDWEKILAYYQERRKPNTDVLARLSKENFIELRDKSRSPFYILKDKTDTLLHRIAPKMWHPPLYVLIAHGDMEYKDAVHEYEDQQRFAKKYGLDFMLHMAAVPWVLLNKLKRESINSKFKITNHK